MGDSNYSIQNYVSSRPTHRSAPQATATRSFVFKLFHRCLYLVSDTQTSFLMLRKRYVCIKETDTLRCRLRRHSCDISGHFKTRGWVTSLCLHFFFLKVPLVSIHLGNTLPRKLLSPLQDESTDCEESAHSLSMPLYGSSRQASPLKQTSTGEARADFTTSVVSLFSYRISVAAIQVKKLPVSFTCFYKKASRRIQRKRVLLWSTEKTFGSKQV